MMLYTDNDLNHYFNLHVCLQLISTWCVRHTSAFHHVISYLDAVLTKWGKYKWIQAMYNQFCRPSSSLYPIAHLEITHSADTF